MAVGGFREKDTGPRLVACGCFMMGAGPGAWIHAVGWIALVVVLDSKMSAPQTAMVLGTLAGAEALGRCFVVGFERGTPDWANVLERVLIRWVGCCLVFLLLMQFALLPFFQAYPFCSVALMGLSLGIAMLRLSSSVRKACFQKRNGVIHARLLIAACGTAVAGQVADLAPETVLSLMILIIATLVLGHFSDLRHALQRAQGHRVTGAEVLLQAAPLVFKNADIFAVLYFFTPKVAFAYILARGLAAGVGLALDHLQEKAAAGLDVTQADGFVAAAARINLGCMLVGGGAALGMLSITPFVGTFLGITGDEFQPIVLWLIMGYAAPVAFGATGLLLGAAFMRRDAVVLTLLGCVVFAVAVSVQQVMTPVLLAQIFATAQLSVAGLGALLLVWRTGIWPGITALLFRQIKLL